MIKIQVETLYAFNEDEDVFYVTDKKTWDENQCCSDHLSEDVYNALCDIGLAEEMDGIWSSIGDSVSVIKDRLEEAGFEYSNDFLDFMSEAEEE